MSREVLFYGVFVDLKNLIKWRTGRDLNSSGLINLKTSTNIYFIGLLTFFNINNFTQNNLHFTAILSGYKYLDKIKPNKNRTKTEQHNITSTNTTLNTLHTTVLITVLFFVLVIFSLLRHTNH